MKRALVSLTAGLIAAGIALPQDLLPPGVLLLSRVKRHVQQELARLPNISCLETVQREVQPAGGKLRALDTVRLEVLTTGGRELYAPPGDRKFSEQHPITYIGSGVIGDGFFGLYLKDVLVGNVSYEYKGEEDSAGRRLARYDYRLPVTSSGHVFHLQEGHGTVGIHGSFWADPKTYDVLRLEMYADDFPPTLPLTEAVTIVNYTRKALNEDQSALLPESGDFRMKRFSGEMDHNHIEFTNCRLFGAQSNINFGVTDAPSEEPTRFGVSSIDDTLRPLPPGLEIAIRLNTKLSADISVGALIDGEVAANVGKKGAVTIAAGSRVRGRVRRMEHNAEPVPHFLVAFDFTELESQGIRYRFYAELMEIQTAPGVERTLKIVGKNDVSYMPDGQRQTRQTGQELWAANLPGAATFFVRGAKLELPRGFRTVWKTLPPGQ